jgi:hypothetical protein
MWNRKHNELIAEIRSLKSVIVDLMTIQNAMLSELVALTPKPVVNDWSDAPDYPTTPTM